MIPGVEKIKLNVIKNEEGIIKHMVKCTDTFFTKFGEIYFSVCFPRKIKAWSRRKKTTRYYVVISGEIKLVLFDGSHSMKFILNPNNYGLVKIPPMVWSGFTALGDEQAIIADFTDFPFHKDDAEKVPLQDFLDVWED
jgi:dTDP-4-dehydrorhamnose 3,5-epimerase